MIFVQTERGISNNTETHGSGELHVNQILYSLNTLAMNTAWGWGLNIYVRIVQNVNV